MLECPACAGAGCDACDDKDRGQIVIDRCPLEIVGPDVTDLLFWADIARCGTWPVAGGALDQVYKFVAECRLIWQERERWRAKLMAIGSDDD